jgi:hypothetical protein
MSPFLQFHKGSFVYGCTDSNCYVNSDDFFVVGDDDVHFISFSIEDAPINITGPNFFMSIISDQKALKYTGCRQLMRGVESESLCADQPLVVDTHSGKSVRKDGLKLHIGTRAHVYGPKRIFAKGDIYVSDAFPDVAIQPKSSTLFKSTIQFVLLAICVIIIAFIASNLIQKVMRKLKSQQVQPPLIGRRRQLY